MIQAARMIGIHKRSQAVLKKQKRSEEWALAKEQESVDAFILLILTFSWFQDGRISYKEFQSTMKAGTEWKKASLGTLVSGFDDFPLEAAARNNGTGESDFFAANTAGAQGESFILIWLKKETEYVNSGSYQQQKKALAIVLTVGENLSQSPIGRSFLLIIIGLKDMLLHLIVSQTLTINPSSVVTSSMLNPQDGLAFKLEYVHPYLDVVAQMNKYYQDGLAFKLEYVHPYLDVNITNESELTYGIVMEEMTTRDRRSATAEGPSLRRVAEYTFSNASTFRMKASSSKIILTMDVHYNGHFTCNPVTYAKGIKLTLHNIKVSRFKFEDMFEYVRSTTDTVVTEIYYNHPKQSLAKGISILKCDDDLKDFVNFRNENDGRISLYVVHSLEGGIDNEEEDNCGIENDKDKELANSDADSDADSVASVDHLSEESQERENYVEPDVDSDRDMPRGDSYDEMNDTDKWIHDPNTHWKLKKPILGERYDSFEQLKD
ncbi:hypothetical protein Tco_1369076 [Tanacetum coccineum]